MKAKRMIHFSHANGIPVETYRKFLEGFESDYEIKTIDLIGMHADYPITKDWRYLVQQLIDDIEQQCSDLPVIGLGHSFGSLVTLMAAYKRPDLFSQLIILDPPFVIGKNSMLFEMIKILNLKMLDKITPAGITLKRKDHWKSKELAIEALRHNRLFKSFDEDCFHAYIKHGLIADETAGGVKLKIPKKIEAKIFRTVPAWWWRTPRKAPKIPVHLITADQSPFYKQGLPQAMQKIYKIDYTAVEGGHMFPLERPNEIASLVQAKIIKS